MTLYWDKTFGWEYPDDGAPPEWNVQDGFAWPLDVQKMYIFEGIQSDMRVVQIWVYQSPTDLSYAFLLPFRSVVPFQRADGKYMGIHPCGAFAVPTVDFENMMTKMGIN